MKISKLILGFWLLLSVLSCSKNGESLSDQKAMMATDSVAAMVSSSAAVENPKDNTRKFIRTAELKFRVKDMLKSTYIIEGIASKKGGFVTYTNLTSDVNEIFSTSISADSSLESTRFTVTSVITLRVPNTQLDSTLREISKQIDYLDFRIIKAEDVALQILANDLTQKRSAKNEERLTRAIDNRGKKLTETTNAEETLLNKQEQADNAKVSNLSLADQIKYCTVNLTIYQRPSMRRELIANDKNIEAYQPSFLSKLGESLRFGWSNLEEFILAITQLWALFLFIGLGYLAYKKIKKRI